MRVTGDASSLTPKPVTFSSCVPVSSGPFWGVVGSRGLEPRMTEPEGGQRWALRVACASQSCLCRLSCLASLCFHPREKLSAWTCHLCHCTCLSPKCVHACVRAERETQHLPSSEEDGTLISGVRSGHLKGRLEWWSVQRSLAVAETGQLGCSLLASPLPHGEGWPSRFPRDLELPGGLRGLPSDSGSPCPR